MNRLSTENLTRLLTLDVHLEKAQDYIIYKQGDVVHGLWIYEEGDRMRILETLQNLSSSSSSSNDILTLFKNAKVVQQTLQQSQIQSQPQIQSQIQQQPQIQQTMIPSARTMIPPGSPGIVHHQGHQRQASDHILAALGVQRTPVFSPHAPQPFIRDLPHVFSLIESMGPLLPGNSKLNPMDFKARLYALLQVIYLS